MEERGTTGMAVGIVLRTIAIAVLAEAAAVSGYAATATDTDRSFVGKVSQGGVYEVAASKLAVARAQGADVRKLAATEVHDHEQVGRELKAVSAKAGVPIAPKLNAEFTERLGVLKAASAAEFDGAYLMDMKAIHDKDEKLFAQEAGDGSGSFKQFAAKTDEIVKRHIAALQGLGK